MRDLAEMFRDAGCADVRTYIQSGNAVFAAGASLARMVPAAVGTAITRRFGFSTPIVIRTAAELAGVVGRNPFLKAGADPVTLHVAFLRDRPGKAQIDTLDAGVSPPDEFRLSGREIYLRCPNGVARSKLTAAYFDTRLKTVSTARNWRTVLALVEMAGAPRARR